MMKKKTFATFAAFSLLCAGLVGVPGGRAMSPEAAKSLEAVQQRAAAGDAEALYRMSMVYERGFDTIPADSLRAMELLRNSARAGYAPAMNYLGFILIEKGDKSREGIDWLQKAADAGDLKAASNIGFMLLNDTTGSLSSKYVNPDSVAAIYLEKAAAGGVPAAMSLLADLFREGRGVSCDTLRATELYEEAAAHGLADAETRLLNMMGPRWIELPADSALVLGEKYFKGKAPYAGVTLLESAAADSGIAGAAAMALLSEAYATGRGAKYDYDKSLALLIESARRGYIPAQKQLAEILEMFPDIAPDLNPEELRRYSTDAIQ